MTRFTQAERVNTDRLRANAIEAAEQCGILMLPEIADPVPLTAAIAALEGDRLLVFCDENAEVADPIAALAARRAAAPLPIAVLIGPRGDSPRRRGRCSWHARRACGWRWGRASCAPTRRAVAALAVVQAALGDWR